MDAKSLFEAIRRDAVDVLSEEALFEKLNSGRRLRVKLGADPSRPDLHLGHSVVLKKLKLMQDQGHEIVFVIGDFTGMIGDPSGRSKTRVPLTFEQTRENGQSYFDQVAKILDPKATKIAYNSEWLSKLNFHDVLALAGKYTLAQILQRDDFQNRYAQNLPIGLHEFFYPLMQGYDSVHLRADIEIGGTDQVFNLLVGRELMRGYGMEAQAVVTFPLLPGLDGVQKMSKSLDNYIGIDEEPGLMYEKCMKVPDDLLDDYFRHTTDIPPAVFRPVIKRDVREAHYLYAGEIVRLYKGEDAAKAARARYLQVAKGGVPTELHTVVVKGPEVSVVELLRAAEFASSNSAARRLIIGRGVSFNGVTIEDVDGMISSDGVLKKGKNQFVRVKIEG